MHFASCDCHAASYTPTRTLFTGVLKALGILFFNVPRNLFSCDNSSFSSHVSSPDLQSGGPGLLSPLWAVLEMCAIFLPSFSHPRPSRQNACVRTGSFSRCLTAVAVRTTFGGISSLKKKEINCVRFLEWHRHITLSLLTLPQPPKVYNHVRC